MRRPGQRLRRQDRRSAGRQELCDGVDNNYNGETDEGLDTIEECDGVDSNCDGKTDEGIKISTTTATPTVWI